MSVETRELIGSTYLIKYVPWWMPRRSSQHQFHSQPLVWIRVWSKFKFELPPSPSISSNQHQKTKDDS